MRKSGEGEDRAVPITVRQLEAFIRLAEASAKARLSNRVEREDAERAINIVRYYLERAAFESGTFDIDIIATGVSHSQRDQMSILRDVIRTLEEEMGMVPLNSILEEAESRGVEREKAKILLNRMARDGWIFTPKENFYKLVGGR